LPQTFGPIRRLSGGEIVTGSEETGSWWADEVRARQERELQVTFALAAMEHALAREAAEVGAALRRTGIELDPLTFVVMRVLDICVEELIDPSHAIDELHQNGSLARSADLASDLLDRDAA
jgi:hypothetical protein